MMMQLVTGSYSPAHRPGIHLYHWDESSETICKCSEISGLLNPSYLCVVDQKGTIYAITENKGGSASWLHIYQLDESAQAFRRNSIPFQGAGSCFVSTDPKNRHAFITNYGEGTLSVLTLPEHGSAGALVQEIKFKGSRPDPERQEQPHPHAALLSKDQGYLYCTDLGADRLYRFSYRPDEYPPLNEQRSHSLDLPAGSGPRHLAFSPDGRYMFLVTELSAEIFVFDVSRPPGTWLQRVALSPEDYVGKKEGGDIQITEDGKFLYASNRGDANEIVTFAIEGSSGKLSFLQRISAAGLSPRSLLICKAQGMLLAANEKSDNISIFSLAADGGLTFTGKHLQVDSPTCLKIMN